jgi:phosphocarrier protein FPr
MKLLDFTINNPTGLHARPAKIFVATAKKFKSDIRVQHGEKKANAKSMISMLTLGVESGSEIHISIDGADEDAAYEALEEILEGGLGEAELIEKTQAAQAAPAAVVAPVATVSAEPEKPAKPLAANVIQGIAAAPGIAIGPLFRLQKATLEIEETFSDPSAEKNRLQTAITGARAQLQTLYREMSARTGAEEAAIFEAHLELLDDPDLLDAVLARIDKEQSAAQAWQAVIDARATMLAGLSDPVLAARSADVHDVGYRVLRLLVGAEETGIRLPDHPVVLVAHDLTPSDSASLPKDRVLGFCTAVGGPTAHAAIIARALSLPAVVSAGDGILDIENGTMIVLDGSTGTLTHSPNEKTLQAARDAQALRKARLAAAESSAAKPAITKDGHRVEIVANVGGIKDTQAAVLGGAEGVGLLRTEFLFLDKQEAPTQDEQFAVYRDIAAAMNGQPVIVRTLDIGGDKPLPYIDVGHEENPFLGERGIRLCLNRPELLREQMRAILRAAPHGFLRVMFPMVADIGEFRRARAIVEEIRAELNAPAVELGIMIEIPSAALMADVFAKEVDFFSVGTNDLTQYTLAMDRQHPLLAGQSDGLHPAVLRLIKNTVDAAHANGKWVGVCGELGADPQAVPILVGMGVDELSVSVPAIPSVKAQIRELTLTSAKEIAAQALNCATARDVRALVSQP